MAIVNLALKKGVVALNLWACEAVGLLNDSLFFLYIPFIENNCSDWTAMLRPLSYCKALSISSGLNHRRACHVTVKIPGWQSRSWIYLVLLLLLQNAVATVTAPLLCLTLLFVPRSTRGLIWDLLCAGSIVSGFQRVSVCTDCQIWLTSFDEL